MRELQRRFLALPREFLAAARRRFAQTEALLRVLGPTATLRRGYSITTTESGEVLRTAMQARAGLKVRTRVSDGEFESKILPRPQSAENA